jgi:hypothetical protein
MATLQEHESFEKLKRFREIIVTEKIDGTNAQVIIDEEGVVRAGSRTRLITPEKDNYGFAAWVARNDDALRSVLGIGRHFGEWFGAGIQRRYGLDHKRFALFNTHRWAHLNDPGFWAAKRKVTAVTPDGQVTEGEGLPSPLEGVLCCVPELYRGPFDTAAVDFELIKLETNGSRAVPGFKDPEGVVVFDLQTGAKWKRTLDGDGHKGPKASPDA